MSRHSVDIATSFGGDLPAFSSAEAAERSLFSERDSMLSRFLRDIGAQCPLDFSSGSLVDLEAWFFMQGEPEVTQSGVSVSRGIGFYFGEVLHRAAGFQWLVQEFAFARGRFEIGVKRGLLTMMLTKGKRPTLSGNKTKQSLLQEFRKYAP